MDGLDTIRFRPEIFLNQQGMDMLNRSLEPGEPKTQVYVASFPEGVFVDRLSQSSSNNVNWYLIVEQPDCQYISVSINGHYIGDYGRLDGRSNLWNSQLSFRFPERYIEEQNSLEITMYSDYMTGIAGEVWITESDDYQVIRDMYKIYETIANVALMSLVFVAIVMLMIIIAWKKRLYNLKGYLFFLGSIILLAILMLDFQLIKDIPVSYFTYKKIILLAEHLTVTCVGLGVAFFFNAKRKLNLGVLSSSIILVLAIFTKDMQQFQSLYKYVNLILILAIIQFIVVLIRNRRSAPTVAKVLGVGLTFCFTQVVYLVLVTPGFINGSISLTVSIIALCYGLVILFIIFTELRLMGEDQGDIQIEVADYGLNSYMQGRFYLDKNLRVCGDTSASCNRIFDMIISGKHLTDLVQIPEEDMEFFLETLACIFKQQGTFKDGYLALLVDEVNIKGRVYHLDYVVEERNETYLLVIMSDITRNKELREELELSKKQTLFIANALKSKHELAYLIQKAKSLITKSFEGSLNRELIMELHTIKGNLSQFGFIHFEEQIHKTETLIAENEDNKEFWYKNKHNLQFQLSESFRQDIEFLEQYLDKEELKDISQQVMVDIDYVKALEEKYKLLHRRYDTNFIQALQRIRYINMKELLSRFADYTANLALEHEKSIEPLEIIGDDVYVDQTVGKEISSVLVAVFRNIVIHGIESPEVRINRGKNMSGKVLCEVVYGRNLTIYIYDDGAGIDSEYILTKALNKHIIEENQVSDMSEKDKLSLVFEDNMSIKEKVDKFAGRGYGLAAVRSTVKKYKGSIAVESEFGENTTIIITIPMEELTDGV
jgi:signal transduction histidine kinase